MPLCHFFIRGPVPDVPFFLVVFLAAFFAGFLAGAFLAAFFAEAFLALIWDSLSFLFEVAAPSRSLAQS
jgi:hypothetical protein